MGSGWHIPLQYPHWFQCLAQNFLNPNLVSSTIVDLIDHTTGAWKTDLVRFVYPEPQCSEILSIPLPKTRTVEDKLLWKHSSSGEFVVKKNAYNLLLKDEALKFHGHLRPS